VTRPLIGSLRRHRSSKRRYMDYKAAGAGAHAPPPADRPGSVLTLFVIENLYQIPAHLLSEACISNVSEPVEAMRWDGDFDCAFVEPVESLASLCAT
jgi:hypothetical protein